MSAGVAARWTVKVINDATREYLRPLSPLGERRAWASSTRARVTRSGNTCSRSARPRLPPGVSANVSCSIGPFARRLLFQPAQRRPRSKRRSGELAQDGDDAADMTEGRWLVNPGSVGQPRDGDQRAACLLLDTDTWTAIFQPRRIPDRGRPHGRSSRPDSRASSRTACTRACTAGTLLDWHRSRCSLTCIATALASALEPDVRDPARSPVALLGMRERRFQVRGSRSPAEPQRASGIAGSAWSRTSAPATAPARHRTPHSRHRDRSDFTGKPQAPNRPRVELRPPRDARRRPVPGADDHDAPSSPRARPTRRTTGHDRAPGHYGQEARRRRRRPRSTKPRRRARIKDASRPAGQRRRRGAARRSKPGWERLALTMVACRKDPDGRARRGDREPLQARPPARCRRHVDRLPGTRPVLERTGRGQAAGRAPRRGRRVHARFRREALAAAKLVHPNSSRSTTPATTPRRTVIHRDGVRRGPDRSRRCSGSAAACRRRSRRDGLAGLRRASSTRTAIGGPPRRQAGQPLDQPRRPREAG